MKSGKLTITSNENLGYANTESGPWSVNNVDQFNNDFGIRETELYGLEDNFDFSSKSIRLGFLRKVFGIFVAQLLFTTGIVSLALFVPSINDYLREKDSTTDIGIIAAIFCVSLAAVLLLNFSKRLAKSYPWNYINLAFMTITLALPVAWISTWLKTNHVFYAGGITLFTCIVIALFTFQTKWDLSWVVSVLLVLVSVGLITLIFFLCLPSTESSILLIGSLAALALSIYLIVFIKLLMEDRCCECCELTPEDYVVAASRIFLIFIVVFLVALAVIAIVASDGKGGSCSGGGGGSGCHGSCFYFPCFYSSGTTGGISRREEDDGDQD